MKIPTIEEYRLLKPKQRHQVREYQRREGLPLYHARQGLDHPLKGQPRPTRRGLQPPRPHTWKSGPDVTRHKQYMAWALQREQAKFRGEKHTLSFDEFVEIWGDLWHNRGRMAWSMVMTRVDLDKGWYRDNVCIMERLQHVRRVGERRKMTHS